MNAHLFPSLVGDRVTVVIPHGLPALMMDVAREVLLSPPDTEQACFALIADYLERRLIERRKSAGDAKMHGENQMKIDYLKKLGFTSEELDKYATVIQQSWKRHRLTKSEPDGKRSARAKKFADSRFEHDWPEELEDNYSDDWERVNVVRKDPRYSFYVPPIPDSMDVLSKYDLTNVLDQIQENSGEDEG